MLGKILFFGFVYWWVFFVFAVVVLMAKTGVYTAALNWLATYNGEYWWLFLIVGAVAVIGRLLLSGLNVQ